MLSSRGRRPSRTPAWIPFGDGHDVPASRIPPILRLAVATALMVVACAVILAVAVLAVIHVDDRYGVSAGSGVWIGLTSALLDGTFYPPIYEHGFYGGTRYMPLPFIVEAGAKYLTNELLVSAKLAIYACAAGLYVLLYVTLRRRGAPFPVAVALVAAVLATAAGLLTTLGIRWDVLATLLQLVAVGIVVDYRRSHSRAALSGLCCALALAAKLSALWAPIALIIWLAVVARRSLGWFLAAFLGSSLVLGLAFHRLSSGRWLENMRLFAFGGSDFASTFEGPQRLYQLALRDQREAAILVVLAAASVGAAALRRRLGPFEIGFFVSIALLLVIMRDAGAYENHLLDLLVLASVVVAGMWRAYPPGPRRDLVHTLVALCILAPTLLAVRYTIIPDMRAALSHELRGKADPRYTIEALDDVQGGGACDLFQDASIPLLLDERPVVLDAFIVHVLQRRRPATLNLLASRVRRGDFRRIVLTRSLDDVGWFAALDFGSLLAAAMRQNYKLVERAPDSGLWIYVPKRAPVDAPRCQHASLRDW